MRVFLLWYVFANSGNVGKNKARVHANPNSFGPQLSNTISLKNENTSTQVSNSMLKYNRFTVDDSATVRVITLVTLIYLPPTSVSVCPFFRSAGFDAVN